jgi:hypothetical protein
MVREITSTQNHIFFVISYIFLYILNIEPPKQSSVQRFYITLQKLCMKMETCTSFRSWIRYTKHSLFIPQKVYKVDS